MSLPLQTIQNLEMECLKMAKKRMFVYGWKYATKMRGVVYYRLMVCWQAMHGYGLNTGMMKNYYSNLKISPIKNSIIKGVIMEKSEIEQLLKIAVF